MQSRTELLQQFDDQGYLILRGLLEPRLVHDVCVELEAIVEQLAVKLIAARKITSDFREYPLQTRFAKLYENHVDDAPKGLMRELHRRGFFAVFFNPRLLDVIELFLGREILLYPNYTARPKLPEWDGTLVLWHQDARYTQVKGTHDGPVQQLRMVNVWSSLVPARVENGCMQFIPGSHKLGLVPHEPRKHYQEISREHLAPLLDRAVNIETDPGDVVLFSNLLFHQGLPNHSKTIRWSLDWRYLDAAQPTMRKERGHLARSRNHPDDVVRDAEHWEHLTFS